MGNTNVAKRSTGDSYAERLEDFKKSEDWQYIVKQLIEPLHGTISTPSSQLATLVILSAGRRGLTNYATLYGDMPPQCVISALLTGHEALILSHESAHLLFGSCIASMGDFMSVALDRSKFDGEIEKKLGLVLVDGPIEGDPTNATAALAAPYALKLGAIPTVIRGLQELTNFHNRHLAGRLINRKWTWSNTAHLALIVMTSIQWEDRLKREFGSAITQPILASLAEDQINVANDQELRKAQQPNLALRLTILRALDVSLVEAY